MPTSVHLLTSFSNITALIAPKINTPSLGAGRHVIFFYSADGGVASSPCTSSPTASTERSYIFWIFGEEIHQDGGQTDVQRETM